MEYEQLPDELPVSDDGEQIESVAAEAERIYIEPPVTAWKLDALTVEQLRQYAAQEGIDLGSAKSPTKISRAIIAALNPPLLSEAVEPDAPAAPEFDLSGLYEHMPPGFVEALTKALHARGIVGPGDYFKSGASELFRSAMLSVIRQDFLSAQALAKTVWVQQAERKAGAK